MESGEVDPTPDLTISVETITEDDEAEASDSVTDAKIDALFDYEEPTYATVGSKGPEVPDEVPKIPDTASTNMLLDDLPVAPPTAYTPPESPTTSIPIEAEVCVKVADNLNISSDAEDIYDSTGTVKETVPDDTDGEKETEKDMMGEGVRPRAHSQGGGSASNRQQGFNEGTGSFHYKTGWIASANVKVRSFDDYNKQAEGNDDVFENVTEPTKRHAMITNWVLFRKKLNSELIRKILDPRRAGRCEPTRVYTIDQCTSKFAISNAKSDHSMQHAHALYLHPETYVSMGIPRVRLSSVQETSGRLSQNFGDEVDYVTENALKRQISADSGAYSTRDEFNRFSFRGEMPKTSAVQTFHSKSIRNKPKDMKEDEARSTESIEMTVDFT